MCIEVCGLDLHGSVIQFTVWNSIQRKLFQGTRKIFTQRKNCGECIFFFFVEGKSTLVFNQMLEESLWPKKVLIATIGNELKW